MKPMRLPPQIVFRTTDGWGRGRRGKLARPAEELRCMVIGAVSVLARHSLVPPDRHTKMTVEWTADYVKRASDPHNNWGGIAIHDTCTMRVRVTADPQEVLAIVLHEYFHLCRGPGDQEKIVSTLTARFKPEVAQVVKVLVDGYYTGAAFLAHAKPGMSYPAEPGQDCYNDQQFDDTGHDWKDRTRKPRGKKA